MKTIGRTITIVKTIGRTRPGGTEVERVELDDAFVREQMWGLVHPSHVSCPAQDVGTAHATVVAPASVLPRS